MPVWSFWNAVLIMAVLRSSRWFPLANRRKTWMPELGSEPQLSILFLIFYASFLTSVDWAPCLSPAKQINSSFPKFAINLSFSLLLCIPFSLLEILHFAWNFFSWPQQSHLSTGRLFLMMIIFNSVTYRIEIPGTVFSFARLYLGIDSPCTVATVWLLSLITKSSSA